MIREIRFRALHVNARTNWSFIEVETAEGVVGVGECSLNGWEPVLRETTHLFSTQIVGKAFNGVDDISRVCVTYPHAVGGVVSHAVHSATEVALLDALAKAQGIPLWRLFRETPTRDAVEVYANINRASTPRTPEGFAAHARLAVMRGFRAIKIAPFDHVFPDTCADNAAQIAHGIACIYAVREAVGRAVKVMVDCHWRFDEPTAVRVLDALREAQLDWFECPVSEANHDAIARLRKRANAQDAVLAGAEMLTEVSGFAPIFARGLYDVVMPDVKYCGGVGALLRIADAAQNAGCRIAPHNPTGPVCNFASVHACVSHPAMDLLEYQLGESELFLSCVASAHPTERAGTFAPLEASGLGCALNADLLSAHPYAAVPVGLDERLG